jgi:lipopolysaccharide transport protein LptA
MTILLPRFFLLCAILLGEWGMSSFLFAAPQRASLEIQADSFELDSKRNILITSGNVEAVQEDIRLKGPYGLYDQTHQRIEFTRGVEVSRGALRLTSTQAVADGLSKRILLNGNVRFYYQDIEGQAEKGSYDMRNQTLVFWVNPIVRQGADQLTGDKIVFDSKTGKVTTSGKARVLLSVDRFQ